MMKELAIQRDNDGNNNIGKEKNMKTGTGNFILDKIY